MKRDTKKKIVGGLAIATLIIGSCATLYGIAHGNGIAYVFMAIILLILGRYYNKLK